jgi:biofilm PGA synthesis protein PgaD
LVQSSDKLHINHPELMTWRQRYGGAFATGVMWAIYTYLWAPLLSLIAWLLGFEFAYGVMIRSGGLEALKNVLWWYALMVGGIIIVVTGWSLFNRLRFANRERRYSAKLVSDNQIAELFQLDSSQLESLRSARVINLSHDESGRIESIERLEGSDSAGVGGTNEAA